MPIPVNLFTHTVQDRLFAFESEDISFGEGETKEVAINRNGDINRVNLKKETVTLTIKGATGLDLQLLETERTNTTIALINGSYQTVDIDVLGKVIYSALLTNVTPTAPIVVNGITLFETIEIEYSSQVYT